MTSSLEEQFDDIRDQIIHGKFKEACDLVEKTSSNNGLTKEDQIKCLLLKSEIKYHLGKYSRSLQLAEKALKASELLKNTILIIKALYHKSAAFLFVGNIPKSLELVEKANTMIVKKNLQKNPALQRTQIRIIGLNGVILANSGKYKIGLEKLQQAVKMAEKFDDKQVLAFLMTHYGLYLLFAGHIEKAEETIRRAREIAVKLGNKQEIALSTMRMGVLKATKLEHKEALKIYLESIEIAKEIGSTHLHFATYMNIGEAYKALFQFDNAIENLKKALTFESSSYAFMIYTNLAEIYFWKKEHDLALEYYLNALKSSNEINDRRYHPIILYNIVNLYVQNKQLKKAQLYIDQLKKIRDEEKLNQYELFYYAASIQFYKASPKIKDWSNSVELAEKILKIEDLSANWRVFVLYSILEIRLRELQINANEDSLKQVQKQLDNVFREAEDKQLHNFIINLYRLKAQLALVKLDIKKAIELLITALTIAKEKGLEILVQDITKEQKKLEEQISMWTKFREQNLPLVDALKQIPLEKTAKNIANDTIVEVRDEDTGKIIEYRKLFALKI
jgi:tetratricopeptide (TPR) repeat protein